MSCIPINDFSLISLCDATKAGKLYSIVPDSGAGDFDVTRASTATYLGSDGLLKTAANNEPRIEFNPDGSYKGLLVEGQRVNYLLQSENFNQSPWNPRDSVTVTPTNELLPDGTTGGFIIANATGTATNTLEQVLNTLPQENFVASVYLKSLGATTCQLRFVNLTTGVNEFVVVNLTNQWQRVSVVNNTTAPNQAVRYRIASSDGDLIAWGGQLEASSTATSYIPTVASTVTRAADVITRTGASALIGQTSGVIQLQADLITSGLNQTIAELYDDTDNYINIRKNASNEIVATLVVAGSTVGTVTSAVQTSGKKDITFSYQTGTCTLSVNGVETTATATGVPATDKIKIGARQNDTEFWNSHVQVTALRPQL